METDPEIQVADFRIQSLGQAAALATMGVRIWPELSLVLGGKKDFDEEVRERRWYQYAGGAPCPGGFRDRNNTYLETVSASQLIQWHRRKKLEKWAPNHVFYAMISAEVNREMLLRHLLNGQAVSSHMVLPADLKDFSVVSLGAPHFQLFAEKENGVSKPELKLHPVTDFDQAVALITVGFAFAGDRTEVRKSEGRHGFRLWFYPEDEMLGKLDTYLNYLKSQTLRHPGPTWDNLIFSYVFLQNRKRLKAAIDGEAPQIIFTAPDSFLKFNPKARNRVAQVHESSQKREEDDILKFMGRKKRRF